MADNALELYREMIRESLEDQEPVNAPNSSSRHASIILEELIRAAKTKLVVFCGNMGHDVWTPSVLAQLESLIVDRKIPVQIVVCDKPDESLVPLAVRRCIRLLALPKDSAKAAVCNGIPHFTMIDDRSARMEIDHQAKRAVFMANQRDVAERLGQAFEILLSQSSPISSGDFAA